MEEANKVPHDDIRSFGRRHGRKLSARQQGLLANVLPRLRIDLEQPPPENATSLFATDAKDVWLEIGFGGGEHLIWQAEHHPNVGLIGCEPYLDGVVKVLDAVETKGLKNIRVLPDDARRLLRSGVGYIKLNSNYDDLHLLIQLFERALRTFQNNRSPGVIIDLRQNTGGAPLGLDRGRGARRL